ncbi:hypothetical protein TraAM80_04866 [Trypanosoma rangeli]|uniref:C2 domain-containing protein n=1 Tax=Trypanosoma rangeli TaxID=5698 RepID=A0A3R7KB42_TRYRA|nr:uncharacterized protein TraAM80_04866 [Trypanosoma rangeli]RNF04670.1 hypothetical protein TraAM80_04866 [Trypanosoma rangeli]|eukprot:RNF04670.1 hypothetical protein TraAM80_04866 [Trypanosoma rangeli]
MFNKVGTSNANEVGAPRSALKKRGARDGGGEARASLLPFDTAGAAEDQTLDTNAADYDPENPGTLFMKVKAMREAADGVTCLRTLDASARSRPPWWLRRLTELKLFLNSTSLRARSSDSVAALALDQLAADVEAAQALEQAVAEGKDGGFCRPSARVVERLESEDTKEAEEQEMTLLSPPPLLEGEETAVITRAAEEPVGEETLAQLVPPWLYVGSAKRMTHQLSQSLTARHQKLLEMLADGAEGAAMKLLGIPDTGGYDGTQCVLLCPAVQRLHASVVRKSILMDNFASPRHLHGNRAQLISDGFRAQTPWIHADYITDGNVRPMYNTNAVFVPRSSEDFQWSETRGAARKSNSFFIHIDYIRFRPTVAVAWQHTGEASREGAASTLQAGPFYTAGMTNTSLVSSAGLHQPLYHGSTKPWISFTQEDKLVSKILDSYEQYRMVELNLLPQLKNRQFYKAQLENLEQQPRLTEEQEHLKDSLRQLLNLTCELERVYLKAMVSAWQQLARLRGEDPNGCFVPFQQPDAGAGLHEVTAASSSYWPSQNDSGEGFGLRRGFLGLSDGAMSLLSDGPGPQTPLSATPFRMYLRRHSEGTIVLPIQEENLLDYTPVIEGVVASSQVPVNGGMHLESGGASPPSPQLLMSSSRLQEGKLPTFRVFVFARTNVAVTPQFMGSTAPRALNSSKVVFFNETFELLTLQEPQEILLHILSVGGSDGDCVIATVSVTPALTRVHLLLPLQAPISFSYRGTTYGKHGSGVLPGIISLSTTWTTIQGMTIEEIEDRFLHGELDPLDPQYEPFLATLKAHYVKLRRNATALSEGTEAVFPGSSDDGMALKIRRQGKRQSIPGRPPLSLQGEDESKRLELLHRRWLFYTAHATPKDVVEARLFQVPIPLEDSECYELQQRITRVAARERRELKFELPSDLPLLTDLEVDLSPRALLLSPLSRNGKLQLWQQRMRRRKACRLSSRKLEDHEILERHVILPKLRPVKGFRLTPESQLNPRREERPKINKMGREGLVMQQGTRIVVHIMKATALPQRLDGTPLEPFVEVTFVYETVVSRSEVGSSPSWFETLNIPFSPPDLDDETLSLIEDDIVISVYDKVEIPMTPTSLLAGVVSHETHYRTERRLLGILRLPFFTLYEADQARVEGQFSLSTPRWVLGYSPDGRDTGAAMNPTRLHYDAAIHSPPSVQLYVALWPPLGRTTRRELDHATISRLLKQLNVSAQLQYLHGIAMKWRRDALIAIKRLSSVNPVAHMREIEPFVFCTTGDFTLVCRYLLANGGPPPLSVTTVEEAIRFVSLLPFQTDPLTWGDNDVWSTNAEFLRVREGDYEELSLLLAHFLRFLAPGEVTYVVTGRGVTHHHVVVVLHSFAGELRLIDPRTGWVCPVHNPHLTFFRDVHMVASHNQLWANVQLSGAPHRMEWDLNDRHFWLPCFDHEDENVRACLPFIAPLQRETLPFSIPEPRKEREIEQQLRKAVRRALVGWRNNRHLAFHHGVAPILQVFLRDAEDELCRHASVRHEAVTMRARDMLNEYFREDLFKDRLRRRQREGEERGRVADGDTRVKVGRPHLCIMGSPVNAAYQPHDTAYQCILQQVFETAVHEVGTNAVSFAIGVYVKGYTSEVYSMWVFLVALYEVVASPSR